jgi:hypothetical protein
MATTDLLTYCGDAFNDRSILILLLVPLLKRATESNEFLAIEANKGGSTVVALFTDFCCQGWLP